MNIVNLKLSEVVVPEDRFRPADPPTVEKISASYLRFGQLVPIIVERDLKLVDGLHRYRAMENNGGTEIAAVYRDEVDELFLREMELEANIQRKEMSWLEREKAIATLHKIRVSRDPGWGQTQTQELVGSDRRTDVSEALTLVKMMELFPEISEAKSKHQAMSWAKAKAGSVLRVEEVKNSPADFLHIEEKIWLGDSVELIKNIPDEIFHAVITDPPFGIDYDDRKANTTGSLTDYEDDRESYERLLGMAPDLYRVIKPDGWLVWFMGISWYERGKEAFRRGGFTVDEIPIIWDRSEGRVFTNRPDRYFGRAYDIALHCIKGNPQLVQKVRPNIIRVAPVTTAERETLVERPVGLYSELIRRLTIPGEIVADFFVGSGSCPAAAASLGRDYFGVELDVERRAYAIKKIRANTPTGRTVGAQPTVEASVA